MNTRLIIASFAIIASVQSLPSQTPMFVQTNGPFGGSTSSLWADRAGNMLAATAGGIFTSGDNGESWHAFSPRLSSPYGVGILAVDSAGHIFAYTNERGIMLSVDNGLSWRAINIPPGAMAIDPSGHIYSISNSGALRSIDGGVTWVPAGLENAHPNVDFYRSGLVVTREGTLFAAESNARVYRSSNSGISWDTLFVGSSWDYWNGILTTASNELLLSANDGLFLSTDRGDTWRRILEWGVGSLACDSSGLFYAAAYRDDQSGWRIWKSSDKGSTWSASNSSWPGGLINSLTLNHKTGALFFTSEAGIHRSLNQGLDWEQINNGVLAASVGPIWIRTDGTIFAAARNSGLFASTNSGESWRRITDESHTYLILSLVLSSRGHIFLGRNDWQGILRSTDEGKSWKQSGFLGRDIFALAINRQDHVFAAVWGTGIYRSTDDGESWLNTTPNDASVFVQDGYNAQNVLLFQ